MIDSYIQIERERERKRERERQRETDRERERVRESGYWGHHIRMDAHAAFLILIFTAI